MGKSRNNWRYRDYSESEDRERERDERRRRKQERLDKAFDVSDGDPYYQEPPYIDNRRKTSF